MTLMLLRQRPMRLLDLLLSGYPGCELHKTFSTQHSRKCILRSHDTLHGTFEINIQRNQMWFIYSVKSAVMGTLTFLVKVLSPLESLQNRIYRGVFVGKVMSNIFVFKKINAFVLPHLYQYLLYLYLTL